MTETERLANVCHLVLCRTSVPTPALERGLTDKLEIEQQSVKGGGGEGGPDSYGTSRERSLVIKPLHSDHPFSPFSTVS